MAKKETDVDVANVEQGSGFSMKKLIIALVLIQVVMFGALGAFLMMSGALSKSDGEAAAGGEHHAEAEKQKEATYISLQPAFTVNFGGPGSSRFMQVTIEVMTHNPDKADQITKHMPVLRNNIVLLLSSQTIESASTIEGKEKLRKDILQTMRTILEERTGSPIVEEVYFTSFVMQ